MIILGIDPGSSRIGYGAIEKDKKIRLITYGTINISPKSENEKLAEAVSAFIQLLDQIQPSLVAIEKIYFSKNRKTGIAVAQTRGAFISEIQKRGILCEEYGPTTVKKIVTGYGHSDKKAVMKMVALSLGIPSVQGYDDAADALAIALTAAYQPPYQPRG